MAKRLAHYYTIDTTANTISIKGVVHSTNLLLITDVDSNKLVYSFGSAGYGYTSRTFSENTEYTTFVLEQNLTALGVTNSTKLQIFVEKDDQVVDFHESFYDPVNKLRVSEPENLIDTDFEYGLQSSKWETLQLQNNIPSFYSTTGDSPIPDVTSVTCQEGSDQVTVNTSEAHRLVVGTPISVQGLTTTTAEGNFLITGVPSARSFIFKAKSEQQVTGIISGSYTSIIPGRFFNGSQLAFDEIGGITTDEQAESKLTINTTYEHGLKTGEELYLIGSLATKEVLLESTNATAPDGRPYVDFNDTVLLTTAATMPLTETRQARGQSYLKINANNVDLANSRIIWPNHTFLNGECVLYSAGNGDSPIGGLNRLDAYFIVGAGGTGNSRYIQLSATRNGSPITFSSPGTYNFSRGLFCLAYEITYAVKNGNTYLSDFYTAYQQGQGQSGRDLINGLSSYVNRRIPNHVLFIAKPSVSVSTVIVGAPYSQNYNSNYVFPVPEAAGTTNSQFHPLEDITRFCNVIFTGYSGSGLNGTPAGGISGPTSQGSFSLNGVNNNNYGGGSSASFPSGQFFAVFLETDEERDTIYCANHGLSNNDTVSITASGSLLALNSSFGSITTSFSTTSIPNGGTYSIEKVSDSRIRLKTSGSANSNLFSVSGTITVSGSTDNPAMDSFYFPSHNFNENEALIVKTVDAGVLPTSRVGTVLFNSSKNIQQAFNAGKTYTESYLTANPTKTTSFTQDGFRPFYQPVLNGGKDVTFSNYNSQFTIAAETEGGGTLNLDYHRVWPANYTEARQETSLDVAYDNQLANLGYNMVFNNYVNGTPANYRFEIIASPGQRDINRFNQQYSYFRLNSSSYAHTVFFRNPTTYTGTWKSAYTATYMAPYSTNVNGVLRIQSIVWDDAWQTATETVSLQGGTFTAGWWWSPEYYNEARLVNFNPNNYVIRANWFFMLPPTTGTWTQSDIDGFVDGWIQTVINTFTYPTLTNLDTVYASIVNTNRFKLVTSNGIPYNFTNSGVPKLNFSTAFANFGALDGIYKIIDVPNEKQYKLQMPFKAIGRTLDINAADEINSGFIQKSNHGLVTGSTIIYDNNGNANLTNLTQGQTYYAILVNENIFKIAQSREQAERLQNYDPGSGSGIHKFKTTTVNGLIPGAGVVSTTLGSATINGDINSLFKRFYKIGDEIIIKNTTVVPEVLETYKVAVIPTDSQIILESVVPFTSSSSSYYRKTQLYVKPDGAYLHRPFDGGVLIKAGTSPYSLICRQTRKYFRYQSGKGIQTSYAINFNPPVQCETIQSSSQTVTVTTRYPHGLEPGYTITVYGASDFAYNGTFVVVSTPNEYTFTYTMTSTPSTTIPNGIVEWRISSYSGSYVRAGMFDFQNGFFFEYDGSKLWCVRRSSTLQLPGTVSVVNDSHFVTGTNTNFSGQVTEGDKLVIRGQSYLVTKVNGRNNLTIQPAYRGISATGVILTKTVDVRVPQDQWSLDVCDGNGPSGFNFDINKIQMCYMDYSWYGAGKIRFGFKARDGHVVYVHEFTHNNRLTESYFRSGNLPARYEIENGPNPSYIPTLFHWGTSVIMDGRFDDDKAYLFTGSSNTLAFSNGQTATATTTNASFLRGILQANRRSDWYVYIPFAVTDAAKFTVGTKLYSTTVPALDGKEVHSTVYETISGVQRFIARVFIQQSQATPAAGTYPVIPAATVINIGQPASAVTSAIDLGADTIPLLSIRLAPSVDSGLPGSLGQREIINRMQLKLNTIGIVLTHDCEVSLIINPDLTTNAFDPVNNPSLCQLVRHEIGDKIIGGSVLYSFRASGGAADSTGKRSSNTTNFELGDIIDLGNSILGGDGVYPNGPDLLTIAIKVIDTFGINATNQMTASARISWAESQA